MKKTLILLVAVGVFALTFGAVSNAYAQETTPPMPSFGGRGFRGSFGGFDGPLHDVMSAAIADALGISVDELDAAEAEGKTAWDLAQEQGLTQEEFAILMSEARSAALAQAVADGTITQEQVDAMQSYGAGQQFNGFASGLADCDDSGPRGSRRPGGPGFGGTSRP